MDLDSVVRTFHPIGQGAFYSERFYLDSDLTRNVVFDCGVLEVDARSKNVVKQAFSKDDIIDYLFISHLDEDHISLVTTLRDSVKFIRNVVLPYIGINEALIQKMLSQALGMQEVYAFWSDVYDELNGRRFDTRYHFVASEIDGRTLQTRVESGHRFDISAIPEWVFIPFCRHIERKTELEANLEELLTDIVFQEALKKDHIVINSVEELKSKISNGDFADLISNRVIKKGLQKAYKNLTEGINRNSLLVYSGPTRWPLTVGHVNSRDEMKWWCRDSRSSSMSQLACLYTGDGDFDMRGYKLLLGDMWRAVGTIQLPHHGSLSSFCFDRNSDSDLYAGVYYRFPVSCGEKNHYGHPSGKVLSYLRYVNTIPIIITESASTIYEQVLSL